MTEAAKRVDRSIPACAGEPLGGLRLLPIPAVRGNLGGGMAAPGRTVYPRVCGGTACQSVFYLNAYQGLSPRVRGNRVCRSRKLIWGLSPRAADFRGTMFWKGLSPRVRGNLVLCKCVIPSIGSAPRCAAEPAQCRHRGLSPRVRGNRPSSPSLATADRRGLSPRVRGNPAMAADGSTHDGGSIPACAGEPAGNPDCRRQALLRGLSPRVRGNPHLIDRHHDD